MSLLAGPRLLADHVSDLSDARRWKSVEQRVLGRAFDKALTLYKSDVDAAVRELQHAARMVSNVVAHNYLELGSKFQ
jgi:hypothetical protein